MLELAFAQPFLPAWLILPMSAVIMIVIAGHVMAVWSSALPTRVKRIRAASGVLMQLLVALFAYASSVARPPSTGDPAAMVREFVLLWTLIMVLLALIVVLACLDAASAARRTLAKRRQMQTLVNHQLVADLANAADEATMGD